MEPLPIPCPAELVPDATGADAFNAAYRQAKEQQVVFVAVERQGPRWTAKADTLTAGADHAVADEAYDAIRSAVIRLIRSRQIRPDSSAGPVYFVLADIDSEQRARELAAALHAALYADLQPLTRAVTAR
ncbi:hypothetical protein C5L38_34865 (plasmid) [Streptomyces sp. WAC00288]|nr:hypothetical protein C5L38_34865 [Streptomyces sp. WAC00288]KYG51049.1 hypothetical protein AWI43_31790 [Streptomyces sp. WAC04657]